MEVILSSEALNEMSDLKQINRLHIDLVDMRLFISISEAKNLTRGAKHVFLSTSAASGRIKALEEQLDNKLLYRDNRGVKLTPAGEIFLRHARLILRQIEFIKSDFIEYSGELGGHIRVFANTTAVAEFMPRILAEFLSSHPLLTIDLEEKSTKSIIQGVREGATDLGIVAGPIEAPDLQAIHFSTDRLVVVTPNNHKLIRKFSISFVDTVEFEQIGLYEGSTLQTFIREQSELLGKLLVMRVQVRSFESMCRMIEAGVGIGIVPESAAFHQQRTMNIVIMNLADSWAERKRYMLVRDLDALPGSTRALISAIRNFPFRVHP